MMNNNKAIPITVLKVRPPYTSENHFFDTVPYVINGIRYGASRSPHFYNYSYGSRTSQEQLFLEMIRPLIDRFARGEDISVVTTGPNYGGKSYTMFGPGLHLVNSEQEYGLLPRSISYIFNKMSGCTNSAEWSLSISITEVDNIKCRDLHTGRICQLIMTEKGLTSLMGGIEKTCRSPSEVMVAIQKAMEYRSSFNYHHTTSVYVKLELIILDPSDPSSLITSTATFIDLAHFKVETSLQLFEGDLWLLEMLIVTGGGRSNHSHLTVLNDLPIFHLLKDSFSGKLRTIIVHCLSPNEAHFQTTEKYLLSAKFFHNYKLMLANQPTNISGSDISFSQSVESADSLFGAMSLNRENDNDSINGHGQPLQCIEEVTESEEEIASSDEKMSESQDSQTSLEEDSCCESDLEDIDKVCQLSNNDFSDNLNNLCQQFYCFVDNFVENFKTKPAGIPVKERKLTCSNVRRGAMQYGSNTNNPLNSTTRNKQEKNDHDAQSARYRLPLRPITKKSNIGENRSDSSLSTSENEDMTRRLPTSVKDTTNVTDQDPPPDELQQKMVYETNRLEQLINMWKSRVTKHHVSPDVIELMTCLSANVDELINCVGSEEAGPPLEQLKEMVKHRARQYRRNKEMFTVRKQQLQEKMKEQVINENEMKDFIVADELIEMIDHAIEYSNVLGKGRNATLSTYPMTEMGDLAIKELKQFSVPQLRYLLSRLFMRIVDMRGSGKIMEQSIGELEQELRIAEQKNRWLNITMQKMRSSRVNAREMVGCSSTADPPSNALALPDARIQKLRYQNNVPRENKKEERGTRVLRNSKKLIILTNH